MFAPGFLKRVMIRSVRPLMRFRLDQKSTRFYFVVSLLALFLRILLVFYFPAVVDDSRLYADIAKNWLNHGVYGITNSGAIIPTLSRLPGYPAFLAAIFRLFGEDNFRAVLLIQVLFDLGTCFLAADLSRRLFSQRAAKLAFVLAAVCPFLANYSAAALTETLEIFFTALAFDLLIQGLIAGEHPSRPLLAWIGCGLSVGACILLRPDGGILLAAIGAYFVWLIMRTFGRARFSTARLPSRQQIILAGILIAVCAVAPLVPWTLRNLRTLHRFEPLAPRYANDSDEPVMTGFNRWVKTWIADYVSVQEIYWNVPGEEIDASRLPKRAFDSEQQKEQTLRLFAEYNRDRDMTSEIDQNFGVLATERIRSVPARYYLFLPFLRIVDMWFRPRTELFPSDPRWWEFNDDRRWLTVSLAFGLINLIYVGMAAAGLFQGRKFFGIGLFVLFLVLRSIFLGTLENPEPRYTLECYPVVIVLASSLFHRRKQDFADAIRK
jgi:4-amino-4-deoxy-L-arabinose transferase-like glycosyltransferase